MVASDTWFSRQVLGQQVPDACGRLGLLVERGLKSCQGSLRHDPHISHFFVRLPVLAMTEAGHPPLLRREKVAPLAAR